jgi:uncharacterized protein (TIGR02996 family)
MHTDDDFLRKLLDSPADDITRLVYADWLDDQDDPAAKLKSAFLRLTVRLTDPTQRAAAWLRLQKKLQPLAAQLDTDWLAVVSRLKIENCPGKPEDARQSHNPLRFDFVCDRRWDELSPTSDEAVRFCDSCRDNVHYCDTIMAAREHAWQGHCVVVDLGVIRRERDLEPRQMVLGIPGPGFYRREDERLKPDPVSAERERRKREAKGEADDGA